MPPIPQPRTQGFISASARPHSRWTGGSGDKALGTRLPIPLKFFYTFFIFKLLTGTLSPSVPYALPLRAY